MRTALLCLLLPACAGSPHAPQPPRVAACDPAAPVSPIAVLGEVARPGQLPFQPGMTAAGAITASGGVTLHTGEDAVITERRVGGQHRVYRVSLRAVARHQGPDLRLCPGDVVEVLVGE